jgi:hypothetical protein
MGDFEMPTQCLFCGEDLKGASEDTDAAVNYSCLRCGEICLTNECCEDFEGEAFSPEDKGVISIVLRNEYERRSPGARARALKLDDLHTMIRQYKPLEPLSKIDNALINLSRKSKYMGSEVDLLSDYDYPYYHCSRAEELISILKLLYQAGFIDSPYYRDSAYEETSLISITVGGYQRLDEIVKPGKDSRQCFVAMWFKGDMNEAYEKAIKKAIEAKDEGASSPRFEAVKIDNVEHTNDINDEIIAQIRRSRFMVCDLTGYRGAYILKLALPMGLGWRLYTPVGRIGVKSRY